MCTKKGLVKLKIGHTLQERNVSKSALKLLEFKILSNKIFKTDKSLAFFSYFKVFCFTLILRSYFYNLIVLTL